MKKILILLITLSISFGFLSCKPHYAEYKGGEVTQDEIDKLASTRIAKLQQEIENVKKRAGEQVLFRELLDLAAGDQGIQKYFSDFVSKQRDAISDEEIIFYLRVNGIININETPSKEDIHKYKSQYASGNMELYRDLLFYQLKKQYQATIRESTILDQQPQKIDTKDLPFVGPSDAPITIVSFTDFQCPYCKKSFFTMRELQRIYKNKIKFIYADFPLHFHKQGKYASLAARCAGDQNKFWQYHDALFYLNQVKNESDFFRIASVLGIHNNKFTTCFKNKKHWQEIEKNIKYGNTLGVQGTPAFFINGHFVSGALPLSSFVSMLKALGVLH